MLDNLIIGLGLFTGIGGGFGLLNPKKFQNLIRNWYTSNTHGLRLLGIMIFIFGVFVLKNVLPLTSTFKWVACILGMICLIKGAAAIILPNFETTRKLLIKSLDFYIQRPLLWKAHCSLAVLLGMGLMVWGFYEV